MRALLSLPLVVILWTEIAYGLMCYTCGTPTASGECKLETNCSNLSPFFSFCKTTVYDSEVGFPFQGHENVVRQCAQSCRATNQNWLGVTNPTFCCNLDLCNRNGIDSGGETAAKLSFLTLSASLLAAAALSRVRL